MNKKTKIFILILIIIILILTFVTLLLPKAPAIPSPSPTPTQTPQGDKNVLEDQEKIRKNQYPLINQTPYRTSLFEVTYVGPLKLKVEMFDKDKEKIKEEVYAWIRENGVNPQTHQIDFVSSKIPF